MKIYQLILASFLVVSCSDYIDINKKSVNNTNSHSKLDDKSSTVNMNDIEHNVKNEYKTTQKQLNLAQLNLKKKTPISFDKPLKELEIIWHQYSVERCNNEFPIDSSRGSIALTENILCLITANELHTTELQKLLSYDLNSPRIIEGQTYATAICSFYKPSHREDCFRRIKKNERIISNLGDDPENISIKSSTSTYIVSANKAFIYKQPDLNSKTSSYFIAGDDIEVLSTKDDWVETSYLKGSKTGWLRLKDLEENSHSNSPPKESSSSKIRDTSKEVQLVNYNQNKQVISKNGIGNISLGQKFKPNEFDEELSYLEGADNCFFTTSKQYTDYKYTLSFQVIDNIITGINVSGNDISNGNNFTSYTGVKIGDTVETVLKLHNKQPDEVLDSPHTDDPIFIYWTDNSQKIGVRYDTVNGRVSSMSLNFEPYIRYFEGCG